MKISVITPSFNQGQFIERTLNSVAQQRQFLPSDIELEHVVYDGGSTDNTVTVLQSFEPPIRFVSEQDDGQAHAVNKGILSTHSDVIGWINSDDVYYPGAIAAVMDYFKANPDIDVVYGMADHIDVMDQAFEAYPTEAWDYNRLQETCIICQPALFFRRNVVEQWGLLDASLNYCMDYEYWLRLGQAQVHFGYLEKKLAGSRLYADNKTLGSRVKVHAEINDMFKRLMGKVPDKWLYNYAHAVVESKIKREQAPARFISLLIMTTMIASLRWNKRLFPSTKRYLVQWGKALW